MSISSLPPPHRLAPEELAAFLHWWRRIADDSASGTDKADRAVLRRCDGADAVVCAAPYHRAFNAMKAKHQGPDWSARHCDRIAVLVGLAAHVDRASDVSLSQRMGQSAEPGGNPRVSPLRFRRLLESPDLDSLFSGLRRVLPLVGHELDLASLAQDLFGWGDPVRKAWAYAYYAPSYGAAERAA